MLELEGGGEGRNKPGSISNKWKIIDDRLWMGKAGLEIATHASYGNCIVVNECRDVSQNSNGVAAYF